MKITRDGKEYELTDLEMYHAYEEQLLKYKTEDILNNLEEYLDNEADCKALENNPEALEKAAKRLRDLRSSGYHDDVALRVAIQEQVYPERRAY